MWLRKNFPKIETCLITTVKDKKVTYSKSSLKLWMGRKYAIKVILVKSYKKILLFFLTKTLKDIRNDSLKLAKGLSQ